MSARTAKQPHVFRVGDKANVAGYSGTIAIVSPMRVCFEAPEFRRWFHRKGNRWVGEKRDDLELVAVTR